MFAADTTIDQSSKRQFFARLLPYLIITAEVVVFLSLETILGHNDISRDGYGYMLYTEAALQENWAAAAEAYPRMTGFPPLLVMTMYWMGKIGLDYEVAAFISNLLSILGCSWGVLYCCRLLYKDSTIALGSAMIIMTMPKLYLEGCDLLRDPMYWLLTIWSLALLLEIVRNAPMQFKEYFWQVLLLGFLLGLSCLSRKEGFFMTFLQTGILAVFSRQPLKHRLWSLPAGLLIAALICSLPWLIGMQWDPIMMFSMFNEGD